MNLALLFSYYFVILFSIIGYGYLSSFIYKSTNSISDVGFRGLLILILISYITNFFVPHSYIHNIGLISVGLCSFIFFYVRNKINKNFYIISLISFSIFFIGLLMYKNHDDFFYYHFPYTVSLITEKKIIGIGLLEHGFRTPSSIFYLNSLFFLPLINYHLLNIGAIFYLGFSNIFFIEKIVSRIREKKNDYILFLSLLSLIFINTGFYRIAEHGTDKSALILIFVFAVIYLDSLNDLKSKNFHLLQEYYGKLIVILLLIISLKSFYIIYLFLFLIWILQIQNFYPKKKLFNFLLINKLSYFFIVSISIFVLSVFLNTGCLIYPASFTCFANLEWSIPIDQVDQMKDHYSLWSKAGINPNSRVVNPELYLNNFNWVINWVNIYFFTKVTDFLSIILLISIIGIYYLRNNKKKINKEKNFLFFYFFVFLFFIEWFVNHPALRYGGYTPIALLVFIPVSYYISCHTLFSETLKKRIFTLIILSFVIFTVKNVIRIDNEIKKYNYSPISSPYYNIIDNAFYFQKMISKIDKKRKKFDKRFYLILNQDLINSTN